MANVKLDTLRIGNFSIIIWDSVRCNRSSHIAIRRVSPNDSTRALIVETLNHDTILEIQPTLLIDVAIGELPVDLDNSVFFTFDLGSLLLNLTVCLDTLWEQSIAIVRSAAVSIHSSAFKRFDDVNGLIGPSVDDLEVRWRRFEELAQRLWTAG
ncbi:hypothetical protein HG530_013855 [Fusarium avenaceum]|nr:hypothetical protein HG530_013855 [Fusarium avenaceum]